MQETHFQLLDVQPQSEAILWAQEAQAEAHFQMQDAQLEAQEAISGAGVGSTTSGAGGILFRCQRQSIRRRRHTFR